MLSSATLFHFTSSLETLKKILGGGFKPFYSSEDLKMFGVPECPGIPMVSFCDIPLSKTQNHVRDYGRYCIGFDKTWGMRKNISPVHYIYEGSICAHIINTIYENLPGDAFNKDCGCMIFNAQTAIFFYGKPYSGRMLRKNWSIGTIIDKGSVTFYDEREWRYVPFADQTITGGENVPEGIRAILSEKEFQDSDILTKATGSLHEKYRLTFKAEDVKYMIVKDDDEIPEMVDFIYGELRRADENTEIRSCSTDDRKRLTTRIISMKQIEQDF